MEPMDPNRPTYQPPGGPNRPSFQTPTADMINRLSLGRKVLLGSSLLLFLTYFFSWYKYELNLFGVQDSATLTGLRGLPALGFLILLVLIAAGAAPLFGQSIKNYVQVAFTEGTLIFYGAIAVAVLVVLGGLIGRPSDWSYAFGFFLAVLAALGVAAGGWLMKQSGE